MGKKPGLTEEEKGKIKAFKSLGLSNRNIAMRLKRSHNLINNFIKDTDNYCTTSRSGRRKVTS